MAFGIPALAVRKKIALETAPFIRGKLWIPHTGKHHKHLCHQSEWPALEVPNGARQVAWKNIIKRRQRPAVQHAAQVWNPPPSTALPEPPTVANEPTGAAKDAIGKSRFVFFCLNFKKEFNDKGRQQTSASAGPGWLKKSDGSVAILQTPVTQRRR